MSDEQRSQLVRGMVHAKRLVGLADFAIAEELADLHRSGAWRLLPYPEGFLKNGVDVSGKKPSSWRGFLEGIAFEGRESNGQLSAGNLESLVALYEWAAGMDLTKEMMNLLGQPVLRAIQRLHGDDKPEAVKALTDAYAQLTTDGKIRLADYRPGGSPSYAIETEQDGDFYVLKALCVTVDGATYRNRIPKRLIHLLCKRLRAFNEVLNA